jgi:hypothetical protein
MAREGRAKLLDARVGAAGDEDRLRGHLAKSYAVNGEAAFGVVDGRAGYGGRKRACWREENQLQVSAVQTPAAVPFAPEMCRSTKLPASIVTPVAGHVPPDPFGAAEHMSVLSVTVDGVDPTLSATVIVLVCCE